MSEVRIGQIADLAGEYRGRTVTPEVQKEFEERLIKLLEAPMNRQEKQAATQQEIEAELTKAISRLSSVVTDTLMPTMVKQGERLMTRFVAIGTPWNEYDAYHYLKNTGQMNFISSPVMERMNEGVGEYIEGRNRDGMIFSDIVGWWKLKWPKMFGGGAVVRERAVSGLKGFWRMFMLDVHSIKVSGLKYYSYPHENIDLQWPGFGGCDLATVLEKSWKDNPGRDYFSLAYGFKTPYNKIVIADGIFEQCTQEALREVGVQNVDTAIVSIGENIESSILVVMILKNMGIKNIIAKAVTTLHGKVLENLHVQRIVFPERDMAVRVAQSLARPSILDQLILSEEYSIVELETPKNLLGKTLKDAQLRTKYGVNLIAIKRRALEKGEVKETWNVNPHPDDTMEEGDILVLIGTNENLEKLGAV